MWWERSRGGRQGGDYLAGRRGRKTFKKEEGVWTFVFRCEKQITKLLDHLATHIALGHRIEGSTPKSLSSGKKKIFFVLVAITTFAQPGGDKVKLSHWLYNIREITIKRDMKKGYKKVSSLNFLFEGIRFYQ